MKKRSTRDQLGRPVEFDFPPQRIISLVPSQTELLFDLGLADRVVGVTRFCVHPKTGVDSKPKVGGTKKFRFDVIDQLQPDLIIGNKEENYEEGIMLLATKYPVWMSDIANLEGALKMIDSIGELVDEERKANSISKEIKSRFDQIKIFSPRKTLYLIWKKPWMAAAKNTFIDAMLSQIGLTNCSDQERYPELSADQIKKLSPEVILLSSEPFPFQQKHLEELREILPDSKILLVDGEMFSWYGSRLLRAPDYFATLELQID